MTQAVLTGHLPDFHILHTVCFGALTRRRSPLKDVVVVVHLSPTLFQQSEHFGLEVSNLENKKPFTNRMPSMSLAERPPHAVAVRNTHPDLQALHFHQVSLFHLFQLLSFYFLSLDEVELSKEENNRFNCR